MYGKFCPKVANKFVFLLLDLLPNGHNQSVGGAERPRAHGHHRSPSGCLPGRLCPAGHAEEEGGYDLTKLLRWWLIPRSN